jgi:hypothetical protein
MRIGAVPGGANREDDPGRAEPGQPPIVPGQPNARQGPGSECSCRSVGTLIGLHPWILLHIHVVCEEYGLGGNPRGNGRGKRDQS